MEWQMKPTIAGEHPVRGVPGYLAVADHVRREVSLGRLLPGERLPPERKFAGQMGVARETLRQALRVLEESGQISITRGAGGGAVILDLRIDLEHYRLEAEAHLDGLMALIDFRRGVESGAAELAAERRAEVELVLMGSAQEKLLAARNRDEFRRADTEFHLAVASATHNNYFVSAVEDVRADMFLPFDLLPFEIAMESSHRAHDRILSAITRRLPDVASGEMRDHIERTRKELLQLISEQRLRLPSVDSPGHKE
jgi:GntR family transcriptional repressor for pyruvate dehydrogenase complex